MAVVPEFVWLEIVPIQREYELNSRQVARLIWRRYKVKVSRQSVYSKLQTLRNWEPRRGE